MCVAAHRPSSAGLRFEETLTGFKWMGNRSAELREREGCTVLFAFEEAIGFCVGDVVKDKDGVRCVGADVDSAGRRPRHAHLTGHRARTEPATEPAMEASSNFVTSADAPPPA